MPPSHPSASGSLNCLPGEADRLREWPDTRQRNPAGAFGYISTSRLPMLEVRPREKPRDGSRAEQREQAWGESLCSAGSHAYPAPGLPLTPTPGKYLAAKPQLFLPKREITMSAPKSCCNH